MFKISIKQDFSSAHNLREYKGKCEQLHGHNWIVEAFLRSDTLNKLGMVEDFRDFKFRLKKILDELDHKYINELEYFTVINPTAENISKYIFDELHKDYGDMIDTVAVWESENSKAEYSLK